MVSPAESRSDVDLYLERRAQRDATPAYAVDDSIVLFTPPVSADYWAYRVRVAEGQAVLGFGKFGTIGIGFAVEDDWNTNLPYTQDTDAIVNHIWHNRGPNLADNEYDRNTVRAAVAIIQNAVREDGGPA